MGGQTRQTYLFSLKSLMRSSNSAVLICSSGSEASVFPEAAVGVSPALPMAFPIQEAPLKAP